ncbi:hypothetical protein J421_1057 [Gemmatirosa kalamazoonensis]|uniref:Uncharacterized protein n=1 Tax=Gemmatirosa kalamazoonensis TaxID=861299 RepID=W0RBW7_9BACT|nr:hypothetical protein J421_1057 [Gemmatirosa kalamazoonensis]
MGRTDVLRSISDDYGVVWQVWAVLPVWLERHRLVDPATGRERLPLPPDFASGWLAFESATGERRRWGPVPDGWEELEDSAIAAILQRAVATAPRAAGPRASAPRAAAPLPPIPPNDTPGDRATAAL